MEQNNIDEILKASYKPQQEASADLANLGYHYDPELSSMDTKVFYDPKTNQPHIAYRGTVRAETWLSNAKIALGGKSTIDQEAIDTAKKVQKKYGKAPTTYGHSRGGRSAELAGEATGGKTYTYNKAVLPTQIFKKVRAEQTDIRHSRDLVSLPGIFQSGGKKITYISPRNENFLSAHMIKSGNKNPTYTKTGLLKNIIGFY